VAEAIIILSGKGFGDISFPLTAESIVFGAQFNLKEYLGYHIATDKWSFQPMSINFLLVAGMDSGANGKEIPGLSDAQSLLDLCQDLLKSSMPTKEKPIKESVSTLRIGSWFVADGYTTNVNLEWSGPWDDTGKPMSTNVTLDFQPVIFRTKQTGKTTTYRRIWREDFNSFGNIK